MLLSNRMINLYAKNVQLKEWTATCRAGNVSGHPIEQWVNDAYILDDVLRYRVPRRIRIMLLGNGSRTTLPFTTLVS